MGENKGKQVKTGENGRKRGKMQEIMGKCKKGEKMEKNWGKL